MDISQFLHVNDLPGASQRPTWRVLKKFGSQIKIREYCRQQGYQRLVLVEDFVGSGTQAAGPVLFAAEKVRKTLPVLFVPLVASEAGIDKLRRDSRKLTNLSLAPIFVVPRHVQVSATAAPREPTFVSDLRKVVRRTFDRVRRPAIAEGQPLDHAFGFGALGMLVALYTNCPNNSLPLIWHSNPRWSALFPRVSRS